jgi:hypothetical protein
MGNTEMSPIARSAVSSEQLRAKLTRCCRTLRAVRAGYVSGTLQVVLPAFAREHAVSSRRTTNVDRDYSDGRRAWRRDPACRFGRSIDDETFAAIECAYYDHAVIFFRDQHIMPPQQVAFTRRFGEIEFNIFRERRSVPGSPEIVVVSNVTEDGSPIGVRRAGENWHSSLRPCHSAAHRA